MAIVLVGQRILRRYGRGALALAFVCVLFLAVANRVSGFALLPAWGAGVLGLVLAAGAFFASRFSALWIKVPKSGAPDGVEKAQS